MKKQLFALSLGFAGLILATQHAYAQSGPRCAPREGVVAHLAEKYGESRHGIGLAANNSVLEIFASDATGTWTIVVTTGAGLTCLIASGENFETVADQLPAKGKGA